jgi:hypothetical protein
MTNKELFDLFKIDDLQQLPDAIMKILDGSVTDRNQIYEKLLSFNKYDLSYDWFQAVFEDELSQRRKQKQDFTPNSVSRIVSELTGTPKGRIYEPTAGNGSMIIADWWNRCLQSNFPVMHFPSDNMVECWELSNRAIPFLLLNLSIRGIMGYVYHGDVLEQTVKCRYILLNRENDTLAFSEIIKDEKLNQTIIEA